MTFNFESLLQPLREKYRDKRFNIFDVTAEETPQGIRLSGQVLDAGQRDALRAAFTGQPINDSELVVLRGAQPELISVATNMTDLHGGPGWDTELVSQVLCGQRLEVLVQEGSWARVRQMDGYLGWVYRPFMTGGQPLPATHLVTAPHSLLYDTPGGRLTGRILGGTFTAVLEQRGEWSRVSVFEPGEQESPAGLRPGWVYSADLRERGDLPVGAGELRAYMLEIGHRFLGTPYLWGGSSANGIDCSGLAQLLHRYAGRDLPRDADLQCQAGRVVEAPFHMGDLVFFGNVDTRRVTHVGISTGGWSILHSSRRRNGVYDDNIQEVEGLRDTFLGGAAFLD